MDATAASGSGLRSALEPLRADPGAAAVLTDLDGTLAPIVQRPEQVAVPDRALAALRELASRYALVAVISGRRAEQARRLIGIDELAYCGNHGLELLEPGSAEAVPAPALGEHAGDARAFAGSLDREELGRLGIRLEDKGPIVALHWRGAADEDAAEAWAGRVASEAKRAGVTPHRGRKVLEIRPGVEVDKGVAVRELLRGRELAAALYGGDDRTDADAFAALRELRGSGGLRTALCVAVASDETPSEVTEGADLTVEGTTGYLEVLEILAA